MMWWEGDADGGRPDHAFIRDDADPAACGAVDGMVAGEFVLCGQGEEEHHG